MGALYNGSRRNVGRRSPVYATTRLIAWPEGAGLIGKALRLKSGLVHTHHFEQGPHFVRVGEPEALAGDHFRLVGSGSGERLGAEV